MTDQTIDGSAQQTAEIERHKYFLSEKAGYDVGWEHAARDWETHHGPAFRSHQARHPTTAANVSETSPVSEPRTSHTRDRAASSSKFSKALRRIFTRRTKKVSNSVTAIDGKPPKAERDRRIGS